MNQSSRPLELDQRYLRTKVPEITILFWGLKLLTTGMGEAMSDFMGDHSVPIAAAVGVFGMGLALWLQFRQREFKAPFYWFVVMMIAIFGTMTADAIHDGVGIGYDVTTPLFAICAAAVFYAWYREQGTLSIHTIITPRRERYYWLAVFFTFALGTAAGDLTATTLNLGFFDSILLFSGIILIPAIGWWKFNLNPVFAFWFAYIDTRPIGASFADWFSKPHNITGLNFGDGHTSACALVVFIALVAYATVTEHGLQAQEELAYEPAAEPEAAAEPRYLGLDAELPRRLATETE
jgi:uncharacterized membrane-anchored protein